MNPINERIFQLRTTMRELDLDAVILPSNDPHQSEYVNDYWKIRTYFSGFTGSAGTVVVTHEIAALWTDSRYFLQVETQTHESEVVLFKQSIPHAPEHMPWLADVLEENSKIGVDYRLFSKDQIEGLEQLNLTKKHTIVDLKDALFAVWMDHPNGPTGDIYLHDIQFAGENARSKIEKVREEIAFCTADFFFLSSLDEIAWLFNLRSSDVDFNPLATAYALVGKTRIILFLDHSRLTVEANMALNKENIEILPYQAVFSELEILTNQKKVIADPKTLNYACFLCFKGENVLKPSIVQQLKTLKNTVEIAQAKNSMLKDGVALTKFFMWLERELELREISEFEIGRKLEAFRKEQAYYVQESFAAIVGYKGNGAIIHYTAPEFNSSMVTNEGILLVDSGAQYLGGTTDITRTVWLGGVPKENLKKNYTLVLKGFIELSTIKFPEKSLGIQLDVLARMHLWKNGLDYSHGTGHGIGSFGMVHEPNQGFAPTMVTSRGSASHFANQLTTIEPGYYKEGEFGIRIENVVLSKNAKLPGHFLEFEPITVFPIDTTLISRQLLEEHEIGWLNSYHETVYETISPTLTGPERNWLREKCKAI